MWPARRVSTTTTRTFGADLLAAGRLLVAMRSRSRVPPSTATSASRAPAASHRNATGAERSTAALLSYRRPLATVPKPRASASWAMGPIRPVKPVQSAIAMNENRKSETLNQGSRGNQRLSVARISPRNRKRNRLTVGEIQRIWIDTPSGIREFRVNHGRPWNAQSPRPSTRPVTSPKQADNDSMLATDTFRAELSCVMFPAPVLSQSVHVATQACLCQLVFPQTKQL